MAASAMTQSMLLVRTTVATADEAHAMAKRLVEGRVACCVHVTPLASTYRWDGQVNVENEWAVEARTVPAQADDCEMAMRVAHPYATPLLERVASTVSDDYARWAKTVL